ncbi:MAG: hypothetical protein EA409_04965 [Saprospirales bacterium]|nr:MAG: hypothetical protein EA409_04965 [Saprospirales bacterium]
MGIRSLLVKPFAKWTQKRIQWDKQHAVEFQKKILKDNLQRASKTSFGKDHHFDRIKNHKDFKKAIPIRDYEELRPYIDRVVAAEENILWPGRPRYLAKTSGTTSGAKYIPITTESLPNHFGTARNAVFNFAASTGDFSFMDGKMIFLSGSPELTKTNGILTGRLSGISNHLIPSWVKMNQMPSYKTNIIEDWEAKLDKIVAETLRKDMRLISGIPPWVQMYFERLLEVTGKSNILEVFPNFSLFVYGGVNYEPYRQIMEKYIGGSVHSLETYPASEGFFGFQDIPGDPGLLLNANSGIFYEFVPLRELDTPNPTRLSLEEVEPGQDYALIISSNAGLWAYNVGDTVRFISTEPYRMVVSGRTKNYISAFGEHVIAKEVEESINAAMQEFNVEVVEFTVAPQVNPPEGGTPYHEWFIEFSTEPPSIEKFSAYIDEAMVDQNIYYKDLIKGKILKPLKITKLQAGAFRNYMKSQGKLGGQNKVPRLSNNREIADSLQPFIAS